MIYLDNGCLVKLYYPEPDSHLVAARVRGCRIVFTPLHELKLTNALRLKRFHKQGSRSQVQAALQLVASDVQSSVLETQVSTGMLCFNAGFRFPMSTQRSSGVGHSI